MKNRSFAILAIAGALALAACDKDADVASKNLSQAVDVR